MKMGTKTRTPGLWETPAGHALRVKVKRGSLTIERARNLPGTTLEEAMAELARLRAEVVDEAERRSRGEAERTVTVFARRWFKVLGQRVTRGAIAMSTAEEYLRKMETHFLPYFGGMEIDELKPSMFSDWLVWLSEQRRPATRAGRNGSSYAQEPTPYKRRSLEYAWGTAKTFLDWVADAEDFHRHPMGRVRFDIPAEDVVAKDTLTPAEAIALVDVADRRTQAMVLVQLTGAMRFSELSGLHWDDLEVEAGTGRIRRSNDRGVLGPPKTDKSRRLFVLSERACELLTEIKAEGTGVIVFPTRAGGYHRSVSTYNKRLKAAAAKAGIAKHVTSHVIRRTMNNAVRQVAGEVAARAVTGHTTKEMTFTYSDVDVEERRGVVRRALEGGTDG